MRKMTVLTVSQLTTYLRALLEENETLQEVFLTGEISNLKVHSASGHFYFDLKDESSVIHAVMFRQQAAHLRFQMQNGMRILARGRISLYEKSGQYQFYCTDVQPDGTGALTVALEQLKRKLQAEGLFAPERKKNIPQFPMRVGVVTSPTGAAIQDILQVAARRFPAAKIILEPVTVQGTTAAKEIAAAIQKMNRLQAADVLLVGRGGGSVEDLWAFNEEIVVRAVAESKIPIISAVGHETDTTLCDYAADFCAPTPSAAAETALPDQSELFYRLNRFKNAMNQSFSSQIQRYRKSFELLTQRPCLNYPERLYEGHRTRLQDLNVRLMREEKEKIQKSRLLFSGCCARLHNLSPLGVLSRGYAIVMKDESAQSSVKNLNQGDQITVKMKDGQLFCKVIQKSNLRREQTWQSKE